MRYKKNLVLGLLICCFCMFTIVPNALADTPVASTNYTHSSIPVIMGLSR